MKKTIALLMLSPCLCGASCGYMPTAKKGYSKPADFDTIGLVTARKKGPFLSVRRTYGVYLKPYAKKPYRRYGYRAYCEYFTPIDTDRARVRRADKKKHAIFASGCHNRGIKIEK